MMNFNIFPVSSLNQIEDLIDSEEQRKSRLSLDMYPGETYIEAFYSYIKANFTNPTELPRYICIMNVETLYLNYIILGNMEAKCSAMLSASEQEVLKI